MKHRNIAIFVPHNGCPQQCSFCNQKTISGKTEQPSAKSVTEVVRVALDNSEPFEKSEIAFFGGSFTAIDRKYMLELLSAAKPFIDSGDFSGIRISTRPDFINEEVLSILKEYKVSAIELGCQSMDDEVLNLNKRGHTAKDVENAVDLIKSFGFELGLQMMTGLYGDTSEKSIETAKKIIAFMPQTVRIYPTVVLKGTELGTLFENGKYLPPTLSETISLCATLLPMFEGKGIKVIRLGLHSSEDIEKNYLAGGYHPALMELVEGEIYFQKTLKILENWDPNKPFTLFVNEKELSKMKGQQKRNEKALINMGFCCKIMGNANLLKYEIAIEE